MPNMLLSTVLALLSCYARIARAEPAVTTTTSSGFPIITDTENTGALDGGASSSHNKPSANQTSTLGSDGADSGFKLSTGAIIGIAIAIAVIIVAFITLWALWFTAKRRNWAVRDTLKYASRRLTGRGAVPPTPKTPRTPHPAGMASRGGPANRRAGVQRDVERGQRFGQKKSSMKPQAGWLEEEKEMTRSMTPPSRGGR